MFDSVNHRRRIYVNGEMMDEMAIDHTYAGTDGDTVVGAAAAPEIQTSTKLTGTMISNRSGSRCFFFSNSKDTWIVCGFTVGE